jgi:hypothetical protein
VSAQQNRDNLPGYPVGNGHPSADVPNNSSAQATLPNPIDQVPPIAPQNEQPANPENMPQQPTAPSNQAVPASLTLAAGTVIQVRTNEWLASDRNLPGDGFNATLEQPIVVDGWVVARRGQTVLGRVTVVEKAKSSNHNTSQLGVQLSELTFADGQLLPIQTQLSQSATSPDRSQQVATVGASTAAGAVIGAIADGRMGTAIGAGVGAIAGLGIVTTHGRPTVIPPETLLTFRLEAPVSLSTVKSQFAFLRVTPVDYNGVPAPHRSERAVWNGAYPPPPAPYWGYPYAYDPYFYPYGWGPYPGPVILGFGVYGGGYRHFGRIR